MLLIKMIMRILIHENTYCVDDDGNDHDDDDKDAKIMVLRKSQLIDDKNRII